MPIRRKISRRAVTDCALPLSGQLLLPLLCVFLLIVFCFNLTLLQAKAETVYTDDFSGDSGLWTLTGTAYRDLGGEYIVLTDPGWFESGAALFKYSFISSFVANFSYRAGGGSAVMVSRCFSTSKNLRLAETAVA